MSTVPRAKRPDATLKFSRNFSQMRELECCIRSLRSRYCTNGRVQRRQIAFHAKPMWNNLSKLCFCFLELYFFSIKETRTANVFFFFFSFFVFFALLCVFAMEIYDPASPGTRFPASWIARSVLVI